MTNSETNFIVDRLQVGMTESYQQIITDEKINSFADLSGDKNPIHLSQEYAEKSRLKKRIAHGLLSASFFSALFGTKLPGPGCLYVSQSLHFRRPVFLGDTVKATIEILKIDSVRSRVFFKTTCTVKNKIVIEGEAEIFIPELQHRHDQKAEPDKK
jgi:3-hydroxybutyryl-CoA dehydratase